MASHVNVETDPSSAGGASPPAEAYTEIAGSGRFGFRHVGGDRIHQGRRQAIIRFKSEFPKPRADTGEFLRVDAGLDPRRPERRKSRRGRAGFLEQFGMDEVKAVERMRLVLDATVHMRAANLAGVPLDRRCRIDDLKLVAVFKNGHVIPWHDSDHREDRAAGFPAFGAAAGMVV